MKKTTVLGCVIAAAAAVLALRMVLPAHVNSASPVALSQMIPMPWTVDAPQPTAKKQQTTFTGTIVRSNYGQFVLQDSSTNYNFFLDNQEKAGKFNGRKVKVTGTLDPTQPLIHVVDIERM